MFSCPQCGHTGLKRVGQKRYFQLGSVDPCYSNDGKMVCSKCGFDPSTIKFEAPEDSKKCDSSEENKE